MFKGIGSAENIIYIGLEDESKLVTPFVVIAECGDPVGNLVTENFGGVGFPKRHTNIDIVFVVAEGVYL